MLDVPLDRPLDLPRGRPRCRIDRPSWVQWEHRPGEASLSVSQRRPFNGPGRVTAPGRFAFCRRNREGANVHEDRNQPAPPAQSADRALPDLRRAGSRTGRAVAAERQCAARALRRQLNEMKHIPHDLKQRRRCLPQIQEDHHVELERTAVGKGTRTGGRSGGDASPRPCCNARAACSPASPPAWRARRPNLAPNPASNSTPKRARPRGALRGRPPRRLALRREPAVKRRNAAHREVGGVFRCMRPAARTPRGADSSSASRTRSVTIGAGRASRRPPRSDLT